MESEEGKPRSSHLLGLGPHGFHRLVYVEWGATESPVLLCVHGLTRNGRDFDEIAQALAATRRVVCPDLPGRGKSEWLPHPADYSFPIYLADLTALLARLGVDGVEWLGTSMGGLLGLTLAAQPGSPIRRLVLNDVGPFVPKTALARIAAYVGEASTFATLAEVEAYVRDVHAPFGLTDEFWPQLAARSAERLPDGRYRLCYDPAIGISSRAIPPTDLDLWPLWDAIRCPVLVLRGTQSDLLTADTCAEMQRRGPPTTVVEVSGVGHAPALMEAGQVRAVRDWLLGD